jgi:toxin YoeB
MYNIVFSKQAEKDWKKIEKSELRDKALKLLKTVHLNPWETYPPFEKLRIEETNIYSRRINIQHRLVYEVLEEDQTIKILRMWTHYGDN